MIVVTLGSAVTTDTTGASHRIVNSVLPAYTIQVVGTGTWTVAVQGSLDGTNWYQLASKTASEIFTVTPVPYLRYVTTGTSGASVSIYAGV